MPCDAFVENGRGQGTGAGGSADHLQIFPSVPLKFSSRVGVLPKPLFILFYLTFKKSALFFPVVFRKIICP